MKGLGGVGEFIELINGKDFREDISKHIGLDLIIEDFNGNVFDIELVSVNPFGDIIVVKLKDGKYAQIEVEIDLGTNSIIDPVIKRIITPDGISIFDFTLIKDENINGRRGLDINTKILDARSEYRGKVDGILRAAEYSSDHDKIGLQEMLDELAKEYARRGVRDEHIVKKLP